MALRITPGSIIKDGESFTNIENELKNFVNDTEILNIGLNNFVLDNTPFVISQSEPPDFLVKGQLWFNRTDGRLYTYFTQGITQTEAWYDDDGFNNESGANGSMVMEPNHWVAMSDRKEVYATFLSQGAEDYFTMNPYSVCRLGAGSFGKDVGDKWSGPDFVDEGASIHWVNNNVERYPIENYDLTGIWASNVNSCPAARLEGWGSNIFSNKLFVHTTGVTVSGRRRFAGVFHEMGYRRVATKSDAVGPDFAAVGDNNNNPNEGTVDGNMVHTDTDKTPYRTSSTGHDSTGKFAWVGYVTESGPATKSHDAGPGANMPESLHTFWFAAVPMAMFEKD
jgi:hypothetical protein